MIPSPCPLSRLAALALVAAAVPASPASDWPMWRQDPGRTAAAEAALPDPLVLHWSRQLPAPAPAYADTRLRFDASYEPVILGTRLFLASNRDDSLAAYDTATGEELWRFHADGPLRFAPVAGEGRVIFGSDDGRVTCLAAEDGALLWKLRAVPSERRVLGNERLISAWPVRGGPVLHQGRVYFAAGVWPLEGTFVFCADAATGEILWRADGASYLYGIHPHDAEAYGGLAPQGYLLVDGEDLVVPSSQAYPARFDLATGELKEFQLPAPGRVPGGWFASTPGAREEQKLRRRGLLFDSEVNAKPHEDKPWSEGLPGIRSTIRAGDREWRFAEGLPGVEGEIHSLAAAGGRLFAVTRDGGLHCLGSPESKPEASRPGQAEEQRPPLPSSPPLDLPGLPRHGHAVLLGLGEEEQDPRGLFPPDSHLRLVAIDGRADRVRSLRQQGLMAPEACLIEADPATVELPPYFASLIVADASLGLSAGQLARLFESLRPFGGILASRAPGFAALAEAAALPRASIRAAASGWTLLVREGALEGAVNYTGDWAPSEDLRVQAPLGLLWFGDSVTHFKRSPQPRFIDGVMISSPKDWTDASTRSGPVDYRLLETAFTDLYTGRILAEDEAPELRLSCAEVDRAVIQPSQYRPPSQSDAWKPEAPVAGERTNPLTGEKEPRTFPKSYGCDGGVDYGLIYSMRSGTPAIYDKRVESGTINISGPRSGCTNSVIPANGLLNLPYFYEGCTCAYPLPVALALVSMPESFEQWASWGAIPAEALDGKLRRAGLNFGAPGSRTTRDGTLWLDLPRRGGPSPELRVSVEPDWESLGSFYQHALFQQGGEGWPWVAGSGVTGIRSVTLAGLKPGRYTLRLTFSEPLARTQPGERVFAVEAGGATLATAFDPAAAAGGPHRGTVLERGDLEVDASGEARITLTPVTGEPVLSGLEILPAGE